MKDLITFAIGFLIGAWLMGSAFVDVCIKHGAMHRDPITHIPEWNQ